MFVRAWKALYGYPHADASAAHVKDAVALKEKAMKTHGAAYPAWVLDRRGSRSPREPHRDGAGAAGAAFPLGPFRRPADLPARQLRRESGEPRLRRVLPRRRETAAALHDRVRRPRAAAALADYCRTVVTATLERHKAGGAVAEKLEIAYLRWLDFGPAAEADAARIYAQHVNGAPPTPADYKTLQDYLFAYVAREAGRLGIAIHIHVANGGGATTTSAARTHCC